MAGFFIFVMMNFKRVTYYIIAGLCFFSVPVQNTLSLYVLKPVTCTEDLIPAAAGMAGYIRNVQKNTDPV